MADSFQALREVLQTGKIPADTSQFSEACQRRLLEALAAVGTPHAPGVGDIAALVRHVLRREDELQGSSTFLKVPKTFPYPSKRDIWQRSGMKILREESDYFLINAHAWQPEWLDHTNDYPPDQPVFKEEVRRNYEPELGDPFLDLVGLNSYRSSGQREAIRAILTMPEGATLTINLPTGSGKSLCAQLPALVKSRISGVSVVVVPTTALALDQERALQPFINHSTAYYGDESEEGKERREAIRERIRQGTQRIVFTSPESLMDSLAPSLYEVAKLGMLRYFVIDEAHMVEQWGDEFRPAFQELPGLRRDLLRLSTFNTLLLTATLTESCLDTLETLFGQSGQFEVISAVQLRPEPAYWFAWCQSEEIRTERLLEVIYHLPRPLIIYATKVDDVKRWAKELSTAGFKRYAVMTGKSTTKARSQLIQYWRERKIDLVIATSAFGLGVDQADVRAVLHVCIPETIDRFYQEVGRGGRDGKAAISLTLYTNEDQKIAKELNEKAMITIERGLQRWQSMFDRQKMTPDGKFLVPINIPPSLREGDIDMDSEKNRAWNIRTLTLISRTGLIKLDSQKPPQRKDFESDHAYIQSLDKHRNSRLIEIINEYHLKPEVWQSEVEPIRSQRQNLSYHNLQLMKEALEKKPKRCISKIFEEAYTIARRENPTFRKAVRVFTACGGCAFCRKQHDEPFSERIIASPLIWQQPYFCIGEELNRLLRGEKLLLIFYNAVEQKHWERRRNNLIRWLIGQGIHNIVAPKELHNIFTKEANKLDGAFIFLFEPESYQPIKTPRIPTLIFHSQERMLPDVYLSTSTAHRVILLPINTVDPSRDDRLLIDIFPGRNFKFESFYMEIGI